MNMMKDLYGISDHGMNTRWVMSFYADGGHIGLESIELNCEIIQTDTSDNMDVIVNQALQIQQRINDNREAFSQMYHDIIDGYKSDYVSQNNFLNMCKAMERRFTDGITKDSIKPENQWLR